MIYWYGSLTNATGGGENGGSGCLKLPFLNLIPLSLTLLLKHFMKYHINIGGEWIRLHGKKDYMAYLKGSAIQFEKSSGLEFTGQPQDTPKPEKIRGKVIKWESVKGDRTVSGKVMVYGGGMARNAKWLHWKTQIKLRINNLPNEFHWRFLFAFLLSLAVVAAVAIPISLITFGVSLVIKGKVIKGLLLLGFLALCVPAILMASTKDLKEIIQL